MDDFVIKTKRVGLRKYRSTDLESFAAINSDSRVMEFFPEFAKLSPAAAEDVMERMNARIDLQGFGFWAAENLDDHQLMGFIGIQNKFLMKRNSRRPLKSDGDWPLIIGGKDWQQREPGLAYHMLLANWAWSVSSRSRPL